MVIGKSKWVCLNFIPYEFREVEEYLNSQALKGWKLEKMNNTFIKFKRIEPRNLKYTVDVLDEVTFIDGNNNEKSMEYRELCSMAKWEFICEKDKFQVYCSDDSDSCIEIHTDEEERFQIIKKATYKYEFSILMIMFMFILIYSRYLVTSSGIFLSNNLFLLSLALIGIRLIIDIIQLINFAIWKIKGEKSLDNGGKVTYGDGRNIFIKSFIKTAVEVMLIVCIIFMGSNIGGDGIKLILLNVVIIFINYGIIHFIKGHFTYKNDVERRNIYRTSMFFSIVIEFVLINFIIFNTGIFNYDTNSKDVISNKINAITIEELGYEIKNEKNSHIEINNGLLADNIIYKVESNVGYMYYELFTSKYKWAIDYRVSSEFKTLKKLDIEYNEIETSLLQEGIKIYSNKNGNSLIIVSDNVYLDISCWNEDLLNSEILNKVLEKVFGVKNV